MHLLPIIENAPIHELPPYLRGYRSCIVVCYQSDPNRVKRVTITSEDTVFLLNLYRKHLTSGLTIPSSADKPDLVERVLHLEKKELIVRKEGKAYLSRNAYHAEYTLIPRAITGP